MPVILCQHLDTPLVQVGVPTGPQAPLRHDNVAEDGV